MSGFRNGSLTIPGRKGGRCGDDAFGRSLVAKQDPGKRSNIVISNQMPWPVCFYRIDNPLALSGGYIRPFHGHNEGPLGWSQRLPAPRKRPDRPEPVPAMLVGRNPPAGRVWKSPCKRCTNYAWGLAVLAPPGDSSPRG
jgi:hypothetical protein